MALSDFERLEQKMDTIIAQNEEILSIFRKVVLYPKDPLPISPSKKKKNDRAEQLVQDLFRAMPHKKSLQEAFNLAVTPSTERIIKYLDTNDPKSFDGLKRNV